MACLYDQFNFSSTEASLLFCPLFEQAGVLSSCRVEYERLAAIHFDVEAPFSALNWEHINLLPCKVNKDLVRYFYVNLREGPDGIESYIRGRRVSISRATLSNVLHTPMLGDNYYSPRLWNHSTLSFDAAFEAIGCRRAQLQDGRIPKRCLSPFLKALHFIVLTNVVPRGEDIDNVHAMEIYLLAQLVNGGTMDLTSIIINHMKITEMEIRTRGNYELNFWYLPYGSLITQILWTHRILELPSDDVTHDDFIFGPTQLAELLG